MDIFSILYKMRQRHDRLRRESVLHMMKSENLTYKIKKVKPPRNRPWRPIGL
jgi:hypothetical protein